MMMIFFQAARNVDRYPLLKIICPEIT